MNILTNKWAYYNEFDPKAAAWIRQLIKDGLISPGEVDERSITDVSASDIKPFIRAHFFAGIATWDYALRLAGWPDDVPVWTASLPCQPFSQAGQRKGKDDDRHLLPHFMQLLEQFRPVTIFGEQVEAAVRHDWLDDLQTNMEAEGYSLGTAILGAHSIGHAHIRNRIYWVASSVRVADTQSAGSIGGFRYVPSENEEQQAQKEPRQDQAQQLEHGCEHSGVADTLSDSSTEQVRGVDEETDGEALSHGEEISKSWLLGRASEYVHPMSGCLLLPCKDGKYRPVEPSIKSVVDATPKGVVHCSDKIEPNASSEAYSTRIKGYGNAIVAPVAQMFISAFMKSKQEMYDERDCSI